MTRQKFLSVIVVLLVITNIAVLLFFTLHKPNHPIKGSRQNPKEYIVEKLGFSDAQVDEFEAMIAIHQFEIEEQEHNIRNLKHELYKGLNQDDFNNKELLNKLAKAQQRIEIIHYNHFSDIKKLCTHEQLPAFNELSNELAKLFAPMPPPHGPKGSKPH